MAHDYDRRDRPATGEETADETADESVAESDPAASDFAGTDDEESPAETRPELERARLLEPRHALEIGRDGRVVGSHYHEGRDTWEILLERYDE
ncbi:hypothetical protein [Halorussus salinus]|uniref:hypothetical protein n=1 Tax=Halorussus salinus TaxID=1364935 RepID=UPI00109266AB|nr:hypothetical protein [Halorussus salinus]